MITDTSMFGDEELRKNWGWLLALGVSLLVLGLIATLMAFATTLATIIFIGFLLLIAGGFEISNAFRHRNRGGFWLHLFSGILDIVCGALLIAYPAAGAAAITLILAIFFLVGGPIRAFGAVAMRLPNRGMAVVSGLVDFALGLILLFSWPVSALWLLGTLVGIAFIFRGAWWISFSWALRHHHNERSDGYPEAHGDGAHGAAI